MILVMVLGIFLLLSGTVVDEFWAARQAEIITSKFYLKEQAYYQAVSILKTYLKYFKTKDTSFDALTERWASPIEIPTPEGEIKIYVEDEERYINLNKIRNSKWHKIIDRLFENLKITSLSPDTLYTWITGQGIWLKNFPPKKAPIESLEELKILGISNKDYYGKTIGFEFYPGLSQVATVISSGKINLNTASPWVLTALSPDIDPFLAEKLVAYRKEHPLKKLDDLLFIDGFTFEIVHQLKDIATVKSKYFKINIEVKSGGVESKLETIVKRERNRFKIIYWKFS